MYMLCISNSLIVTIVDILFDTNIKRVTFIAVNLTFAASETRQRKQLDEKL